MKTLARTRAETLFASLTSRAESALDVPAPSANQVQPPPAGPNTLHLPTGTRPSRVDWPVTRLRRLQTGAMANTNWA